MCPRTASGTCGLAVPAWVSACALALTATRVPTRRHPADRTMTHSSITAGPQVNSAPTPVPQRSAEHGRWGRSESFAPALAVSRRARCVGASEVTVKYLTVVTLEVESSPKESSKLTPNQRVTLPAHRPPNRGVWATVARLTRFLDSAGIAERRAARVVERSGLAPIDGRIRCTGPRRLPNPLVEVPGDVVRVGTVWRDGERGEAMTSRVYFHPRVGSRGPVPRCLWRVRSRCAGASRPAPLLVSQSLTTRTMSSGLGSMAYPGSKEVIH